MVKFTSFLFITALSATGAFAELKSLLNWPNGLTGPFDGPYSNRTFSPLQSIGVWGSGGRIPEGCKDIFVLRDHSPNDVRVFSVKYNDCDTPWTFCRHKDAELSIEKMADLFGRMPVHMRSLVRHPIALPRRGCSAEAWTNVGDIVMYGPCRTVSVWVHETGHQLDARLNPSDNFSGSDSWIEALDADTCVPDSYANNNRVEDFAQVTVAAQFDALANYLPTQKYPGCLNKRLDLLEKTFGTDYLQYGGCCRNRPVDSKAVSTRTSKRDVMKIKRRASAADPAHVGPCHF